MSKKPKKPTDPFGHIAFGKDGSVNKHTSKLSHNKEKQEAEVMERFITAFNQLPGKRKISSFEQLPEADHDFVAESDNGLITIQLTELVESDYAKPITKEEYNKGIYKHYILKTSGEIPWAVDMNQVTTSLKRSLEKKLKKYYAGSDSETLWLLVFCTSFYVSMVSDTLVEVRKYLAEANSCVFDEIWYTNLVTKPVRVWPVP